MNKNKHLGGTERKLLNGKTSSSKKQLELTTVVLVSVLKVNDQLLENFRDIEFLLEKTFMLQF